MKLQSGQTLVMIGDSITDCGRTRPIGEGVFGELGDGYVALTDAILASRDPALGVRVVNVGCGGHTVRDLAARWQTDVLDLRPDWLTIGIGINDVWRQFDDPDNPDAGVLPNEYASTLARLVDATRPTVQGLILLTPFLIEPDTSDPMRAMMDEYGSIVKDIAARRGVGLVDTQAAFDRAMCYAPATSLAGDRVHPNLRGHMLIAQAVLDALDAPG